MQRILKWAGQQLLTGLWYTCWPIIFWRWTRRARFIPMGSRVGIGINCIVGALIALAILALSYALGYEKFAPAFWPLYARYGKAVSNAAHRHCFYAGAGAKLTPPVPVWRYVWRGAQALSSIIAVIPIFLVWPFILWNWAARAYYIPRDQINQIFSWCTAGFGIILMCSFALLLEPHWMVFFNFFGPYIGAGLPAMHIGLRLSRAYRHLRIAGLLEDLREKK